MCALNWLLGRMSQVRSTPDGDPSAPVDRLGRAEPDSPIRCYFGRGRTCTVPTLTTLRSPRDSESLLQSAVSADEVEPITNRIAVRFRACRPAAEPKGAPLIGPTLPRAARGEQLPAELTHRVAESTHRVGAGQRDCGAEEWRTKRAGRRRSRRSSRKPWRTSIRPTTHSAWTTTWPVSGSDCHLPAPRRRRHRHRRWSPTAVAEAQRAILQVRPSPCLQLLLTAMPADRPVTGSDTFDPTRDRTRLPPPTRPIPPAAAGPGSSTVTPRASAA